VLLEDPEGKQVVRAIIAILGVCVCLYVYVKGVCVFIWERVSVRV